jgi:shikimate dehydrogenase
VLGSPIRHSLSPVLHRTAYAQLGLTDWSYDAYELGEDDLPGFVAGLDHRWRGLSLTMPLKAAVMALGEPDPVAEAVGVGNTLLLDPDGRRVFNTDVPGLVWALRRAGLAAVERAVVLGTGATARSALVALAELGTRAVTVVARSPEKADALRPLADRLGVDLVVTGWSPGAPDSDVLVSTVVAGAADERADQLAGSAPVVVDALYEPWPTPLARAAAAAGARVVSGLDLLVGQALRQIELMTGRSVPAELLLDAGRAALAARA